MSNDKKIVLHTHTHHMIDNARTVYREYGENNALSNADIL